jgi:A/G-specific adenine glycosylase
MNEWFGSSIIAWYGQNKRDLPWRNVDDPYLIWLSEIILQQTQVSQGLSYYHNFASRYPRVKDLANASEDEVLKLWQGLGYYSRARNLLYTAKQIAEKYEGVFPSDYQDIRSLKGIGDYTAAAIASFAFKLPYPVIDGNVYRLLSRVFGIETPIDTGHGKKQFALLASDLLNRKRPAIYNQAIMEFGSQYCRPVNPDCANCVLSSRCSAYKSGKVNELPVKSKKLKIRNRYFNYIMITNANGEILIRRREKNDIWKGLYEFNLIETEKEVPREKLFNHAEITALSLCEPEIRYASKEYKHILTHQHLHAKFYIVKSNKGFKTSQKVTTPENLKDYAFPRLIEKFLSDCDLKEIL